MNALFGLIAALAKGHELKNAAAWKNRGAALSALTAIISAGTGVGVAFGLIPAGLMTAENIAEVSAAAVSVVGVTMSYLSIATSKKVGAKPKGKLH